MNTGATDVWLLKKDGSLEG